MLVKKIVLIDDDNVFLELTSRFLKKNSFETFPFDSWDKAKGYLESTPADLVLVDLYFPNITGIQIIEEIRLIRSDMPILMITAHSSIQTAIEAVKAGAIDYIQKPCENSEILFKIQKTFELAQKEEEIKTLKQTLDGMYSFQNLTTRDDNTKKVFNLAKTAADLDIIVLICGETGTGKEVLAKTIHMAGPRASAPFIVFNCAAINENLIESELFGHKKGSFTSAHADKKGMCEIVENGTLFIDEIGELSIGVQKKLLRLLQEKEFESVGATSVKRFNGRLMAATNRILKDMVREGNFREDLFYRLNVFPIQLSPLRERLVDLLDLADFFLKKYNAKYKKNITGFTPGSIDLLMKYSWPGNIRELEHFIERQILICKTEKIHLTDSSHFYGHEFHLTETKNDTPALLNEGVDYTQFMKQKEEEYLKDLLNQSKGSIEKAAATAGIHRKTLYLKLKEHNLDKKIFKEF